MHEYDDTGDDIDFTVDDFDLDAWLNADQPPAPKEATQTQPGTRARIDVYRARFESGESLHHPDDLTWPTIPSCTDETHARQLRSIKHCRDVQGQVPTPLELWKPRKAHNMHHRWTVDGDEGTDNDNNLSQGAA